MAFHQRKTITLGRKPQQQNIITMKILHLNYLCRSVQASPSRVLKNYGNWCPSGRVRLAKRVSRMRNAALITSGRPSKESRFLFVSLAYLHVHFNKFKNLAKTLVFSFFFGFPKIFSHFFLYRMARVIF